MPFAFVQESNITWTNLPGRTLDMGLPLTAGNHLAALVITTGNAIVDVTSIAITTDTPDTPLVFATGPARNSGLNNCALWIYYLGQIPNSGAATLDIVLSEVASGSLSVIEFSGGDGANLLDAAGLDSSTGPPVVSLTSTVAGDFAVTACTSNASGQTPQPGYTAYDVTGTYWYDDHAYNEDVGAPGAKDVGFTLSSLHAVVGALFKQVPTAGGLMPQLKRANLGNDLYDGTIL